MDKDETIVYAIIFLVLVIFGMLASCSVSAGEIDTTCRVNAKYLWVDYKECRQYQEAKREEFNAMPMTENQRALVLHYVAIPDWQGNISQLDYSEAIKVANKIIKDGAR